MGGENLDFLTYLVMNKVFGYIKVDFQQYWMHIQSQPVLLVNTSNLDYL